MAERSPLSQREIEAFTLKFEGLQRKKIAEQLQIPSDTVRHRTHMAYDHLHVHSSIEALHAGIQQGLLDPQELASKIAERIGLKEDWPERLSPSEWETALVATDPQDGESIESIGKALHIPFGTARGRLHTINNKLGTRSHLELAVLTLGWMQSQPIHDPKP